MTVILTSSPTGPLDQPDFGVRFDEKNGLVERLRRRWKPGARCLIVSAFPDEAERNDEMRAFFARALEASGLPCSAFDVWDSRNAGLSEDALRAYDVLFLGGGHVPTQNAFFRRIGLREKRAALPEWVIGISAGSMNCADIVYAQPELPEEATDPGYVRFLDGLGLTDINVLPHYQMVKDSWLDGKRLFEDITCPDSVGHTFLALPDGSYLWIENGRATVYGEAYRVNRDGVERICPEGGAFELRPAAS